MKLADMLQVPRADKQGQHQPQPPPGAKGDAEARPACVRPISPQQQPGHRQRGGGADGHAGKHNNATARGRLPGAPASAPGSRYPARAARASRPPPSGHRAAQPGAPRLSPAPRGQLRGCRGGRAASGPIPTPEEPPSRRRSPPPRPAPWLPRRR